MNLWRSGWSADDIPDLSGRTAVVTGANSGLGLQTCRQLARHGAHVVLACRDAARGEAALATVQREGEASLASLDLADLASVRAFAGAWQGKLDILVCNAGVMAIPRRETADGFEMQFGTNHLGHFALTGLLMPALQQAHAGRVVAVSSNGHKIGRISFDDLQGEKKYSRAGAYAQSKLANLLFIRELSLRLAHAGSTVVAAASHPGYAATNLTTGISGSSKPLAAVLGQVDSLVGQTDADGALPSLYAATMPDVVPNDYLGPRGPAEQWGSPVRVGRSRRAQDSAVATRLWEASQELTGVSY